MTPYCTEKFAPMMIKGSFNVTSTKSQNRKSQLELNASKCIAMSFKQKENLNHQSYIINGKDLKVVDSCKYLNIDLGSNMKYKEHVQKIIGMA